MATKLEQYEFIIRYIAADVHGSADVTNAEFQEKFWQKFGGKRKETNWGAQPVYKAQERLRELYGMEILQRGRVVLEWADPGLPNWIYVYRLNMDADDAIIAVKAREASRLQSTPRERRNEKWLRRFIR